MVVVLTSIFFPSFLAPELNVDITHCGDNALSILEFSIPPTYSADLATYLSVFRGQIIHQIETNLNERGLYSCRAYMKSTVLLERHITQTDKPDVTEFYVNTSAEITCPAQLDIFFNNVLDQVNIRINDCSSSVEESGWAIKGVRLI